MGGSLGHMARQSSLMISVSKIWEIPSQKCERFCLKKYAGEWLWKASDATTHRHTCVHVHTGIHTNTYTHKIPHSNIQNHPNLWIICLVYVFYLTLKCLLTCLNLFLIEDSLFIHKNLVNLFLVGLIILYLYIV